MYEIRMPHVLYVEDDPLARKSVSRELIARCPEVQIAATYTDAVRMFEHDLLWCGFVVDYNLPRNRDEDPPEPLGLELLERARRVFLHAPAMLLTGQLDRDLANRCAALNITYLPKGPSIGALDVFCDHAREAADHVPWRDVEDFIRSIDASPREAELIRLAVGQALPRSEIAAGLGVSENTVKTHIRHILAKSNVASLEALRARILSLR